GGGGRDAPDLVPLSAVRSARVVRLVRIGAAEGHPPTAPYHPPTEGRRRRTAGRQGDAGRAHDAGAAARVEGGVAGRLACVANRLQSGLRADL
ncbi:MAG: hypothetical protein ABJ021_06760, partial [Nitratireductor sp.]